MLHAAMMTSSAHLFIAWIKDNAQAIRSFVLFGDSFLHQVIHLQQIFHPVIYANTEYPPPPDVPLLKLLLEVYGPVYGANVTNKYKQTPLHLISEQVWRSVQGWRTLNNPTVWENAVQILIDHGAHLDLVCYKGVEAGHGLARRWPRFNFVKGLKCTSARAIVDSRIKYNSEVIPKAMCEYVQLHEGRRRSEKEIYNSRDRMRVLLPHEEDRREAIYVQWERELKKEFLDSL